MLHLTFYYSGHSIIFEFLSCAYDVDEVLKALNRFYKRKEMQKLASDHGLDGEEFTCHFIICL